MATRGKVPISREAFVNHVKQRAVELHIVSSASLETWFSVTGLVNAAERVAVALFIKGQEDRVLRTFLHVLHGGLEISFDQTKGRMK